MPIPSPFASSDEADPPRRRRRSRAQMMGEVLLKQASAPEPVYSPLHGFAKVAAGALGGFLEGKAEREEEERRQQLGSALLTLARGGPSTIGSGAAAALPGVSTVTPSTSYNPNGKLPSFASGDLASRKQAVVDGLVQRGLSPNAAAAYAGNFAVENKADPVGGVGDNGTAFGLAQWRNERFTALKQLAASQGKDWRDLGVQLDHTVAEHKAMPAGYQNALATSDPAAGANLVMRQFERPSNKAMADTGGQRAAYAQQAYDRYIAQGASPAQAKAAAQAETTAQPQFDNAPVAMLPNTDSTGPMVPAPPPRPVFADMAAPGAVPTGTTIDGASDGMETTPEGFVIPPAPQISAQPAPMSSDVSVPMPPDAAPDIAAALASMSPTPGPVPDVDPTAEQILPEISVDGRAPPPMPLPPSRPAGLDVAAAPIPAPVIAPSLPPARPDFANMPAPGARETSGQFTPAQRMGQYLLTRDVSNSTDGGAGDFARSQGGIDPAVMGAALSNFRPGQDGTSGNPQAQALGRELLAQPAVSRVTPPAVTQSAPAATSASGAPQNIFPPGASGGPTPGPNGPVQASPQPESQGFGDRVAGFFGLGQSKPQPSFANREQALEYIVRNGDPTHVQWALGQLNPKTEHVDLGDSIGFVRSGQLVSQLPKSKTSIVGEGGALVDNGGRELYRAQPKNDLTPDQRNFSEAQKGGFPGSFNDFLQQKTQRQGQSVTVEDENGNKRTLFYDPQSNSLKTPQQMGAPAPAAPTNPYSLGKVTEDQGKAAGFATRMANSHGLINELEHVGTGAIEQGLSKVPGGNYLLSAGKQRLIQAQSDFINAILRRESGAAIGKDEFANYGRQYFPVPGDTPENIEQKRQSRETAIEGTMGSAGPNYRPPEGYKRTAASTPAPTPTVTVQAPPAAIEHLRQNPGMKDAFDQKYGRGAASRILGGQ